jgi:hypothetical protein
MATVIGRVLFEAIASLDLALLLGLIISGIRFVYYYPYDGKAE